MATDLNRGAYSGKETVFQYNSATHATPTWVTLARARNVQVTNGPALSDVEFHGTTNTSKIPGYSQFSGSFEYVRKRGSDTAWDAIIAARDAGDIIELRHLNGPDDDAESKGWKAPCLLGEFSSSDNGGDVSVVTIPFGLADAYDSGEVQIGVTPDTGVDPGF